MRARSAQVEVRLVVDWPACHARGICAELVPELVRLDEWGYPIVDGHVTDALLADARAAVRSCPTLALRLLREPAR